MNYKVTHLPKEHWKGQVIPIEYTTQQYYDVVIDKTEDGFHVNFSKKPFETPVTHRAEEYDYPDKLYEDYREDAFAWGVIEGGKLIAAIETCPEKWSNRLRITELWVDPQYHKKGIGHSLMLMAKEQVRQERRRAIILETQSCNVNAIGFYLHEGFTLSGFDSCCYANNDLERKEVRIELGWFPTKGEKLTEHQVTIRKVLPEDWYETEEMTRRAFWNKHHLGCDEHYLVHKMSKDEAYLPELSRIAVVDGKIVGCILYSKAYVIDGDVRHELLTFGPLSIDPDYQGRNVGGLLLRRTMKLAADAGYRGIALYGEPDYYPRIGFKTCDHFGITTPDGKNFDAFMGIELIPGGMENIHGKFYEAEVFENLPKEEVEEFDKQFPYLEKMKFPSQWD